MPTTSGNSLNINTPEDPVELNLAFNKVGVNLKPILDDPKFTSIIMSNYIFFTAFGELDRTVQQQVPGQELEPTTLSCQQRGSGSNSPT
jgi:hypothetical protein